MTFVDDALPAARPTRNGPAVKGQTGEEGGAFRDTFKDLGRSPRGSSEMAGKTGRVEVASAFEKQARPEADAADGAASMPDDATDGQAGRPNGRASASARLSASLTMKTVRPNDTGIAPDSENRPAEDMQALDQAAKARATAAKLANTQARAATNARTDTAHAGDEAGKDAMTYQAEAGAGTAQRRLSAADASGDAAPAEDLAPDSDAMPTPGNAQSDLRSLMSILEPAPRKAGTEVDLDRSDATSMAGSRTPAAKAGTDRPNHRADAESTRTQAAVPGAGPEEGVDQIFRFARADGRSNAVSMRADAEGLTATGAGETAAKMETVTVLDARRYLGLAPSLAAQLPLTGNGQAVTSAIAGSTDLARALQADASLAAGQAGAAGKVVNTLKIQMHPIDLGMVTATLRLRDEELQIDLRVQSGEAYRQLSDDQDAMIKALRAQGFQVDQVNIIFSPSDSGAGRDAPSQGGQQQAFQGDREGQGGRDGQGGFTAGNGGGARNGSSGHPQADNRQTGNDSTRETAPASQPGLSGDLYL
jgi:flagellar hook-length control protein FliK